MKRVLVTIGLAAVMSCAPAQSGEVEELERRMERWTACVDRQMHRVQQSADLAVLAHIEGEQLPGAGFPDDPITCEF